MTAHLDLVVLPFPKGVLIEPVCPVVSCPSDPLCHPSSGEHIVADLFCGSTPKLSGTGVHVSPALLRRLKAALLDGVLDGDAAVRRNCSLMSWIPVSGRTHSLTDSF